MPSSSSSSSSSDIESNDDNSGNDMGQRPTEQEWCRQKSMVGTSSVLVVYVFVVTYLTKEYTRWALEYVLAWMQNNLTLGFFLVPIIYALETVLLLPWSVDWIRGCGYLYANWLGYGWGIFVVSMGAFVGALSSALVSFWISRSWIRSHVVQALSNRYVIIQAFDEAVLKHGTGLMILLRLCPMIPFGATNYIAGGTSLSRRAYVLTILAVAPLLFIHASTGASADDLRDSISEDTVVAVYTVLLGIILGVFTSCLLSCYTVAELDRLMSIRMQLQLSLLREQATRNIMATTTTTTRNMET